MLRIGLPKNADESLSARHVDALPASVVIRIVGILHTGKGGDHLTGIGVENRQARWFMRGHEQPMIHLV